MRSIFTNVPLQETIKIIADYLYSDSAKLIQPFDIKPFIKLLEIATGGIFMHRNMLFQQTDDISMGNPLDVTMSNFFLVHIENMILQCEKSFHLTFYVRYVDDVFCVFRSTSTGVISSTF